MQKPEYELKLVHELKFKFAQNRLRFQMQVWKVKNVTGP